TARVTKAILLARCALPKRDARLIWSLRKSLIVVVAQVLFSSTPIHHAAAETVQLVHKDGDYLEPLLKNEWVEIQRSSLFSPSNAWWNGCRGAGLCQALAAEGGGRKARLYKGHALPATIAGCG